MNLPSLPGPQAILRATLMTAIALVVIKIVKPYMPQTVRDLLS